MRTYHHLPPGFGLFCAGLAIIAVLFLAYWQPNIFFFRESAVFLPPGSVLFQP
jgi:hypothetical protein